MKSRREFIKTGGTVCLAACGGVGLLLSLLQSCAPSQILHVSIDKNKITVPIQSFAAKKVVVVRNINLEDDIAIIKKSETEFAALLMQCTHQQNPVQFNGSGFYCSLHGSTFDLNGNVTAAPASSPLIKYSTEIISDNLIIHLK